MIPESTWALIKDDYINGAGTLEQLAFRYDISRASIENRSRDENWKFHKKTLKIARENRETLKINRESSIDVVEILEETIQSLRERLNNGKSGSEINSEIETNSDTDSNTEIEEAEIEESEAISDKDFSGLSNTLIRALEFHRKIVPETPEQLARRVVELGLEPAEFAVTLTRVWGQKET